MPSVSTPLVMLWTMVTWRSRSPGCARAPVEVAVDPGIRGVDDLWRAQVIMVRRGASVDFLRHVTKALPSCERLIGAKRSESGTCPRFNECYSDPGPLLDDLAYGEGDFVKRSQSGTLANFIDDPTLSPYAPLRLQRMPSQSPRHTRLLTRTLPSNPPRPMANLHHKHLGRRQPVIAAPRARAILVAVVAIRAAGRRGTADSPCLSWSLSCCFFSWSAWAVNCPLTLSLMMPALRSSSRSAAAQAVLEVVGQQAALQLLLPRPRVR